MLHISNSLLLRPSLAFFPGHTAKVGALREYEKPHRVFGIAKLLQVSSEPWLVKLPLSRQEDEVVELCAPTENWNILERLLEDDVDAAMHFVCIRYPPKI